MRWKDSITQHLCYSIAPALHCHWSPCGTTYMTSTLTIPNAILDTSFYCKWVQIREIMLCNIVKLHIAWCIIIVKSLFLLVHMKNIIFSCIYITKKFNYKSIRSQYSVHWDRSWFREESSIHVKRSMLGTLQYNCSRLQAKQVERLKRWICCIFAFMNTCIHLCRKPRSLSMSKI